MDILLVSVGKKIFNKIFDIIVPELFNKINDSNNIKNILMKLKTDIDKKTREYKEYEIVLSSSKFDNFLINYCNIEKIFYEKINYNKPLIKDREKYIKALINEKFDSATKSTVLSYFKNIFELFDEAIEKLIKTNSPGLLTLIRRLRDDIKSFNDDSKNEILLKLDEILKVLTNPIQQSSKSNNSDILNRDIDNLIKEKAEEFSNEYKKPLFSENLQGDGEKLTLEDMYVTPSYCIEFYEDQIKYNDIEILLNDFEAKKMREYFKEKKLESLEFSPIGLFIIGQPGIGKTSLTIKIANDYLAGNVFKDKNVFFIRFKNLDGSIELLESICKHLNLVKENLENSILFLDGLDELAIIYSSMDLYLNDFVSKLAKIPNSCFIITSRANYIVNDKDIVFSLFIELQIYTKDQINKFIDNYSKKHKEGKGRIISSILNIQTEENDLFNIPLILYLILSKNIIVTEDKSKGKLYNEIFAQYGGKNKYGKDIGYENLKHWKIFFDIAQDIAYDMFKKNKLEANKEIVDRYVTRTGKGNEQLEKVLSTRFGIDNFYEFSTGRIKFIHTSIFEYFAAKKIFDDIINFLYNFLIKFNSKVSVFNCMSKLEKILYGKFKKEILDFIFDFIENDDPNLKRQSLKDLFKYAENYEKIRVLLMDLIKFGMCVQPVGPNKSFWTRANSMFLWVYNIFYKILIKYKPNENSHIIVEEDIVRHIIYIYNISNYSSIDYIAKPKLLLGYLGIVTLDNRGANLKGADLKSANLRGANLKGVNLSGAELIWTDLSEANLCEAFLSRAVLNGANLSGANLSGAYLREASLISTNLRGIDLSKANLKGADLSKADLFKAKLCGANLSGADLRDVNLNEADLNGADLSEAFLSRALLGGTDLSEVDLSGAFLGEAFLGKANLSEAKLVGDYLNQKVFINGMKIYTSDVIYYLDVFELEELKSCCKIYSTTQYNNRELILATDFEINQAYNDWQNKNEGKMKFDEEEKAI
jgi:uncharacterized protein YjbI with pentapeptide repeats/GTPase SAR1 family protein